MRTTVEVPVSCQEEEAHARLNGYFGTHGYTAVQNGGEILMQSAFGWFIHIDVQPRKVVLQGFFGKPGKKEKSWAEYIGDGVADYISRYARNSLNELQNVLTDDRAPVPPTPIAPPTNPNYNPPQPVYMLPPLVPYLESRGLIPTARPKSKRFHLVIALIMFTIFAVCVFILGKDSGYAIGFFFFYIGIHVGIILLRQGKHVLSWLSFYVIPIIGLIIIINVLLISTGTEPKRNPKPQEQDNSQSWFTFVTPADIPLELEEFQTVWSTKSSLSFEFPTSWSDASIGDASTIYMGHERNLWFFSVIEEPVAHYIGEFTFDDYVSLVLEMAVETYDDLGESLAYQLEEHEMTSWDSSVSNVSDIIDLDIGDGISAKQFEVSGTVLGYEKTYQVTCLVANNVYYTLIAYTVESSFDDARTVFNGILNSISFDKTNPSPSPDPAGYTGETQTVKSQKSNFSLEVPAIWRDKSYIINDDDSANNSIAVIYEPDGAGLYVYEDIVTDIHENYRRLDNYTSFVLDSSTSNVTADDHVITSVSEIVDVEIGKGIKAKQFMISGIFAPKEYTAQVTCFENDGILYRIEFDCIQSTYDEIKPLLDKILASVSFD